MTKEATNVTKLANAPSTESLIIAQTPWTAYNDMPLGTKKSVRDMKDDSEVSGAGVYQIAMKKDMPVDKLVAENIGYIGMGVDVFKRCTGIRTGKHACGKMLKHMGVGMDDVMIRFLFTEKGKESTLEGMLHKQMNKEFGYRYKWKKASGGISGIGTQIVDMLDKCDQPAELVEIITKSKERFTELMLEQAIAGDLKSYVDDNFGE